MAAAAPTEPEAKSDPAERQKLSASISAWVLQTLGKPENLREVQVRKLWKNNYRVNVFVGDAITNSKIAHSYFMVADPAGAILSSTPNVTRLY